MKFKHFTLLIVLSVFVLSACQNTDAPSPDKIKNSVTRQEKFAGQMQSLGGAFNSSGATHLLRKNDGKSVFLKSNLIDLNSEKYNAKQVEIMGELKKSEKGGEYLEVKSIDLIETTEDVATNQPQWIDYNSENLAIGLKYRDDYQLTESAQEILIEKKVESTEIKEQDLKNDQKNSLISIKLLSNDENFDLLGEMGLSDASSSSLQMAGFVKSKITQKALDAYKKSSNDGSKIAYYTKYKNSYLISFESDSEDSSTEDQNMFFDILASIDFDTDTAASDFVETTEKTTELIEDLEVKESIESNDNEADSINGFETFKSESQKFSLQYPKSFYFGSVSPASGASKSYQFGDKPLEEADGDIQLDIKTSTEILGNKELYNSKELYVDRDGSNVSVAVIIEGKTYLITAPSSKEAIAKKMASTLKSE